MHGQTQIMFNQSLSFKQKNCYKYGFDGMWVPVVKTGESKAFWRNGRGGEGKGVPIQTVKSQGGVVILLHSILTSILEESGQPDASVDFLRRKSLRNRRTSHRWENIIKIRR